MPAHGSRTPRRNLQAPPHHAVGATDGAFTYAFRPGAAGPFRGCAVTGFGGVAGTHNLMTQCDVYIGPLSGGDDPLDWGRDPNIGNVPGILDGTRFPPRPYPRDAFSLLIGKIKDGKLPGKQVDWGAWAANVSKDDIIAFINEAYEGDRTYTDPNYWPHLYPKLQELFAAVHALPDNERFALTACEL